VPACDRRARPTEAALGHSPGAVEKAYKRGTGIEALRMMMDIYATWLLARESKLIAFPTSA
jgi:hypothetical protein